MFSVGIIGETGKIRLQFAPEIMRHAPIQRQAAAQHRRVKRNMGAYRVAILSVGEVSLHSALLAVEPFRAANRLGQRQPFQIEFVGLTGGTLQTMIGIPLPVRACAEITEPLDLVFVLACYETEPRDKPRLLAWLRAMRQKGALIAGLDAAPLLLAEAGLLANRRATAHWSALDALAERHPEVQLEEALYVIDGTIATCAGQIAVLDLALALLKRVVSPEMFQAVQDDLVVRPRAPDGEGQRQRKPPALRQGDPNGERSGDRALIQARALMAAHIEEPLALAEIASRVGLSLRELQRRFRGQLGRSPIEAYRSLRLERALHLLHYSELSIREIGIATGFDDPSTFYRAFRARYGQSPQALRIAFRSAPAMPNGRRIGFAD